MAGEGARAHADHPLAQIDQAYSDYLASMDPLEAGPDGSPAGFRDPASLQQNMVASMRLLDLGRRLANLRQASLENHLLASQVAVERLQRIIFGFFTSQSWKNRMNISTPIPIPSTTIWNSRWYHTCTHMGWLSSHSSSETTGSGRV